MENKAWKYNNLLTLFEKHLSSFTIDGVGLKDCILDPTIDWLVKKYTLFNRKYFDNKLTQLHSEDFKIIEHNRAPAYTDQETLTNPRTFNVFSFERPKIYFGRYYKRTEKQCCEILLHEMIHIYVVEVVHKLEYLEGGHGSQFINKLNEINSYGWSVPLFSIRSDNSVFKSIKKQLDQSYLLAVKYNDQSYYVGSIPVNYLAGLRSIPQLRIFLIKNSAELLDVIRIDNIPEFLRDFQEGGFVMTTRTEEELNDYITRGIIEEVTADGVLRESANEKVTKEDLDKAFGEGEVLPNGLIKYHVRYYDYF